MFVCTCDTTSCPAGFFVSYNSSALQPNVTESVGQLLEKYPNASLYIIGHSMGAAMAHVCILDLKFKYNIPKERLFLYTFGSPRIGNDIFAKFLREQVQVGHPTSHLFMLMLRSSFPHFSPVVLLHKTAEHCDDYGARDKALCLCQGHKKCLMSKLDLAYR